MKRKLITLSLGFALLVLGVPGPGAAEEGDERGHASEEASHDHAEEGVVTLTSETAKASNLEAKEAGPRSLKLKLKVNGRIAPVSSKVAHIAPRFPGIIREVRKDVGDRAEAGDILAVIESNQTLQIYEVRTSRPGLITNRHATVGESVQADEPLFILMDFTDVWADFTAFQRDSGSLEVGQPVTIFVSGREVPISSTLRFISPVVDEDTQSRVVRAVISNPDGRLAPGAFVTGEIATGEFNVPVAVTVDAIQTIDGKSVVFIADGDRFTKRDVRTGRTDGSFTEVLSGVKAGERYASGNTFILKAELGKGEAEHED